MSNVSGIKPVVDITKLPSRERMKELLANAGFTVIDKGTETAPTGKPLVNSMVVDQVEAVAPVAEVAAEPAAEATSADSAEEQPDDTGEAPRRRRK